MKRFRVGILFAISVSMIAACVSLAANPAQAATDRSRAVVIMSGGAAISPFTTNKHACKQGYAAGSTDSFMRSYFKKKGYRVFTAPAMAGLGKVTEQPGEGGPFGKCPKALPAYMTVNSAGDIDLAGVHLANFVNYLHKEYGIDSVDFVAHSMGGLYSRSAIAYLKATGSKVSANTLSTMGTPWAGTFFADATSPDQPNPACDNFPICESLLQVFGKIAPVVLIEDKEANIEAMNTYYEGALKGIPVTLVAGNAFTKSGGSSHIWPNDGIVAEFSAFAATASDKSINHRICHLYEGGTHSVYISEEAKLADSTAITWNDTVGDWIYHTIKNPQKALKAPNRQGCPVG